MFELFLDSNDDNAPPSKEKTIGSRQTLSSMTFKKKTGEIIEPLNNTRVSREMNCWNSRRLPHIRARSRLSVPLVSALSSKPPPTAVSLYQTVACILYFKQVYINLDKKKEKSMAKYSPRYKTILPNGP